MSVKFFQQTVMRVAEMDATGQDLTIVVLVIVHWVATTLVTMIALRYCFMLFIFVEDCDQLLHNIVVVVSKFC